MPDVAVRLVSEYLQACGYLVQTEVPVRRREHGHDVDVTDLDILAVRFPGHASTAADDAPLEPERDLIDLIIGEVKQGKAHLNAGLFRTASIEHALRMIGCCPEPEIPEAAQKIARGMRVRLGHSGYACRARCIAFAGRGSVGREDVVTVRLSDCALALAAAVNTRDAYSAVAADDDIAGLLHLLAKIDPPVDLMRRTTTGGASA